MPSETTELAASATASEALRAQISETRENVVSVVSRIDHLRLQVIPGVQATYALRIGCWEVQLVQAELACRRAKRKLALVRAKLATGSQPNDEHIEAQLDAELAEWQQRAAEALAQQREHLARIVGSVPLTPAEARRMKRLYHTLARRLHPDLHPGKEDELLPLYAIACSAYRNGQLDVLHALEASTRHLEPSDDLSHLDAPSLEQELEFVQVELNVMKQQLGELENSPMLELERLLEDPSWVARKVAELKASIAEFEAAREAYERKLVELKEQQ